MLGIRNSMERIAYLESFFNLLGAVLIDDTPEILFNQQLDYDSNSYHREYKIAVNRRFGIFCDWMFVTFRYNKMENTGELQIKGRDRRELDKVIDRLKLLSQNVNIMEEDLSNLQKEVDKLDSNGKKIQADMKSIGVEVPVATNVINP